MKHVPTLIPADGPLLQRILDTADDDTRCGLTPAAFARLDTALRRTPWGERHLHRMAWVSDGRLLASARCSDLLATLDGQSVRVRGIGELRVDADHGVTADPHGDAIAEAMLAAILEEARDAGIDYGLLRVPAAPLGAREAYRPLTLPADAIPVPTQDVELQVAEPLRYGAPMMLVRAGEDRDLAFIATINATRAEASRFSLTRDPGLIRQAITRARLLAGLAPSGARQLQFVVTEEGMRAAGYVVLSIVGNDWTIEECGDRDPTGARVGAILQALIAIERVEQRPVIRGWLPPGFVPPQATVVATTPSTHRLALLPLRPGVTIPPLTAADVCLFRGDVL